MDEMLAPDGSEDLFGETNVSVEDQPDVVEAGGDLDAMLANDDNDDLFANEVPPPAQQPEISSSALIEWERTKSDEISEMDNASSQADNELRQKASESLNKFHQTLTEAQQNRAKHNKEVDEQTIADIEATGVQKWERVVSFIDFNRSDLHTRDVSKMKSLLLQLKH